MQVQLLEIYLTKSSMHSEMLIYRLILNTLMAVLSHQFIFTYTTVAFIGEACLTSLDHRTTVTWAMILVTEKRHNIQLQDVLTIEKSLFTIFASLA